jgi:hypothetical protein
VRRRRGRGTRLEGGAEKRDTDDRGARKCDARPTVRKMWTCLLGSRHKIYYSCRRGNADGGNETPETENKTQCTQSTKAVISNIWDAPTLNHRVTCLNTTFAPPPYPPPLFAFILPRDCACKLNSCIAHCVCSEPSSCKNTNTYKYIFISFIFLTLQ